MDVMSAFAGGCGIVRYRWIPNFKIAPKFCVNKFRVASKFQAMILSRVPISIPVPTSNIQPRKRSNGFVFAEYVFDVCFFLVLISVKICHGYDVRTENIRNILIINCQAGLSCQASTVSTF